MLCIVCVCVCVTPESWGNIQAAFRVWKLLSCYVVQTRQSVVRLSLCRVPTWSSHWCTAAAKGLPLGVDYVTSLAAGVPEGRAGKEGNPLWFQQRWVSNAKLKHFTACVALSKGWSMVCVYEKHNLCWISDIKIRKLSFVHFAIGSFNLNTCMNHPVSLIFPVHVCVIFNTVNQCQGLHNTHNIISLLLLWIQF